MADEKNLELSELGDTTETSGAAAPAAAPPRETPDIPALPQSSQDLDRILRRFTIFRFRFPQCLASRPCR